MEQFNADNFLTFTIGIIVFFIGLKINKSISFLRTYNIPEAVTGGFIAATLSFIIYKLFNIEITYQLEIRDVLIVYFFTGIGLNARLQDLIKGGKPLIIMLFLTLGYIIIQNIVGIIGANIIGAPAAVGVLAGSASLIGGHGTAIAWAPDIAALGIEGALEIGVACATIGLIIASLIGGPIAHNLIQRFHLKGEAKAKPVVGISFDQQDSESINHMNLMSVFLTLHLTIIGGWFLNIIATEADMKLPLFVTSLLTGIILSNTVPRILPKIQWPARSKALAIISDFSLSLFLVISLMSMQLWSISELAGTLMFILILQTIAAIFFIIFILFPSMGKDYQAAVLSSGFGGFALGATPTAIANMTAVTKKFGVSHKAFIVVPLVGAFFIDISNAMIINTFLIFLG